MRVMLVTVAMLVDSFNDSDVSVTFGMLVVVFNVSDVGVILIVETVNRIIDTEGINTRTILDVIKKPRSIFFHFINVWTRQFV